MDPSSFEFTLYDEYGSSLTLDANRQEIRSSDGYVISLEPEQTPIAATGFHSTVEGDSLATSLDNLPPPNNGCRSGEFCEQSIGMSMDPDGSGIRLKQVASDTSWQHVGGTFGSRIFYDRRNARRPRRDNLSAMDWDPKCDQIAQAIKDATPKYKAARVSFWSVMRDIIEGGSVEIINGRPTVKLPTGSALAALFEYRAYEQQKTTLEMSILGVLYNSYGCGTFVFPSSSGGSGGGGMHLVCHYEWWEISFDGGSTWEPVKVSVCEYSMT